MYKLKHFSLFNKEGGVYILIAVAVICTIISSIFGAILEPVSLSVAIPISVTGAFILKAIENNNKDQSQ